MILWRDGAEKSRVDRREGSEYSARMEKMCDFLKLNNCGSSLFIDLHGSGKRFFAKLEC